MAVGTSCGRIWVADELGGLGPWLAWRWRVAWSGWVGREAELWLIVRWRWVLGSLLLLGLWVGGWVIGGECSDWFELLVLARLWDC